MIVNIHVDESAVTLNHLIGNSVPSESYDRNPSKREPNQENYVWLQQHATILRLCYYTSIHMDTMLLHIPVTTSIE